MHTTVKQIYVLMLSAEGYLWECKKNKAASCSSRQLVGVHGTWQFGTVDKLVKHWIEDKCENWEWWK